MSCLSVRDVLPELAVGVLPLADREDVERHLRWCAGCRKEAAELEQAAATLALGLDPAMAPAELGDRVVERVRHATGASAMPRRARMAVAAIVAAMVAVASLGWGAVMAGRADRFADRADLAERQQVAAIDRLRRVFNAIIPIQEFPEDQAHLGRLTPAANEQGGGAVLQLVSDTITDFTIVIVNGLDPEAIERMPYRVQLANAAGDVLKAGRIDELDANGGATAYHEFSHRDLTGYTIVRVLDAAGNVVLSGQVDQGV